MRPAAAVEARELSKESMQRGPPRKLVGKRRRMGEDPRQQCRQAGAGLEQPVEIDPARDSLDDIAQPIERMVGIGARWRLRRAMPEASPRMLPSAAGERSERAPARPPFADPPHRRVRVAEAELDEFSRSVAGSLGKRSLSVASKLVERARRPRSTQGREPIEQFAPLRETRADRATSAIAAFASGSRWVCWSSIICTRCSMVRSRR